jgi:hypothetical protein
MHSSERPSAVASALATTVRPGRFDARVVFLIWFP